MRIEEFLLRLEKVKKYSGYWMARCPAHNDNNPSLQVSMKGGRIWLNCYAKCSEENILKSMGLTKQDLYLDPPSNGLPDGIPAKWYGKTFVALWPYRDAQGNILGYTVRYEDGSGKDIIPFFRKNGNKWKAGGPSEPKPLYGLDKLAKDKNSPVLIIEGEKAADAAQSLMGKDFVCLCWLGGCKQVSKADWSPLSERLVYIWPDADEPGLGAAGEITKRLKGIAAQVKIVSPPTGVKQGWDLADAKKEGWDKKKVLGFLKKATGYKGNRNEESGKEESSEGSLAKRLFPRVPFPWDVFPEEIAASFKQLARSLSTSPHPIPGEAFCVLASLVGDRVILEPKRGWSVRPIFWHMDLRSSGEGKTSILFKLARFLIKKQSEEYQRYEEEQKERKALPKKEREKLNEQDPIAPPRPYFVSDLTTESLRDQIPRTPTKSFLILQNELSAQVGGLNQYKGGKGTDREVWLGMWDGCPAVVSRVGKSYFIPESRVSICGGMQPEVFVRCFDELFQVDGTLFRFLIVYEPPTHYPLTRETWDDRAWNNLLEFAHEWSINQTEPLNIMFTSEAWEQFCEWRDNLDSLKIDLPPLIRGFLPKIFEYCLRLTLILYLIECFHEKKEPAKFLGEKAVKKGITVARFYLSQIAEAVSLFDTERASQPVEVSERTIRLAKILQNLKRELDNGKLAVGYILEKYNEGCPPYLSLRTPKSMGAFLRNCNLKVTNSKHDANGKKGVRCLEWDETTDKFINFLLKQSPESPESPENKESSGITKEDITSGKSGKSGRNDNRENKIRTFRTSKEQSPGSQTRKNKGRPDIPDIPDIIFSKNSKNESHGNEVKENSPKPDLQEPPWLTLSMEEIEKDGQTWVFLEKDEFEIEVEEDN